MKHMVGCEVSNSLPSTSFRYKTKAEKLFWGSGCEIRRRVLATVFGNVRIEITILIENCKNN